HTILLPHLRYSVAIFAHPPHPFFFTDPPTPDISTLSLHDALPILRSALPAEKTSDAAAAHARAHARAARRRLSPRRRRVCAAKEDRKSTRLNSSHLGISYAVFCLKKKKKKTITSTTHTPYNKPLTP